MSYDYCLLSKKCWGQKNVAVAAAAGDGGLEEAGDACGDGNGRGGRAGKSGGGEGRPRNDAIAVRNTVVTYYVANCFCFGNGQSLSRSSIRRTYALPSLTGKSRHDCQHQRQQEKQQPHHFN